MGKKKLIAETGAGQHGVALATAAALVGLECDIYMGEVDMAKERPNVVRMKILGANVIPATEGLKTLKEAVDAAFGAYVSDPVTQFYAIGSVVGPHPFPMMVRDFQSVVGREAKAQFKEMTGGNLPDNLVACVGGGCNAIGLFSAFLDDAKVKMFGVEPAGTDLNVVGKHAATMTLGTPGTIHGFKCYLLQDEKGAPAARCGTGDAVRAGALRLTTRRTALAAAIAPAAAFSCHQNPSNSTFLVGFSYKQGAQPVDGRALPEF
mgnify:CR=1 FL=1